MTYAQCKANSSLAGCTALIAACAKNPGDPICGSDAAVTIAQCSANPSLAGCTALCAASPGACSSGLTLAQCTANPALAGCTTLIATCTKKSDDPMCSGGAAVTIAQCTANPALAGCTALCAASPGACTSSGLTLAQCKADSSLAGCAALVATCTKKPDDPMCSGGAAVTIAQCTANPALAGCTALCAASPGACSGSGLSYAKCVANPLLAGCATLIATCRTQPDDPLCTGGTAPTVAVTIAQCKITPSLPGCAVLCAASPGACPSVTYAQCAATPTLVGCAPLLAACKTKPTDPVCTGGTATLADCAINPALTGCTALCAVGAGCTGAVTIAQCSFNPTLSGCAALCAAHPGECSGTAVTIAQCTANPALPGCAALCAVSSCTCAAPQVLQNGVCVTPATCKPPQVLKFGACVTPAACKAPQVLQAGVCVTPVATAAQVMTAPAANVTVDSTGALVVADPTAPIVLSADAQKNALVKLDTLKPVSFTSGDTTLQYTDQAGAAQLVVRTVDNKPHLEVAKGTVQIRSPSAGSTISVMSSDDDKTVGSIVTQTKADSVVVVKTDTTAAVFVDSGHVNYQGPGQSTPVPVYQGENTRLDADGNLSRIALGSRDGLNQVPGDPLPVKFGKDSGARIPNLEGPLPRFDNAVSLLDIVGDYIKSVLGDTTGQLSYDRETGVVTYMLGNTAYRVIALGDVLVALNGFSATDSAATAGGAYAMASRGIQMSLSGAVGYFSDLQTAVEATDANGTLSLKSTGAIEARFGGGRYVVMPGLSASLPGNPSPLPGFESDANGYAVFRDHMGTLQTLYPAFLDMETLNTKFKTVAPTGTLTYNGDGSVTAGLTEQNITLRPEYTVIDKPAGNPPEPYWQDNGVYYFRNGDQSAQGFRAQ
ncbi:MAG: hypothetical protein WC091_14725 [Sulfuricellaceae bacterium]